MNMDNELFWKLLEPIHPKAENFCRKLTGDRDDGDDLYQEAILNAMARFGTLKDKAAFQSWLYRIIVNGFKNRRRIPWWRRVTLKPDLSKTAGNIDPRAQYDSRRWLNRAMAVLSPEDKAMVILYEIDGWPIGEMVSIFEKPEGTIKARLWRARRKMRQKLESYLPAPSAKGDKNTGTSAGDTSAGDTSVGGKYALQRSDSTDK